MFKVYVIMFGLIAVVTSQDQKSVTAILLKTDGFTTSEGVALVPHKAKALYRPSALNGALRTFPFDGKDLTFTLTGSQASFPMNLRDIEKLPRLASVLGSGPALVLPGCLGASPGNECRHNGLPLVAGRVKLSGGWTLRPVEVVKEQAQPTLRDHSIWGFRSVLAPSVKAQPHGEMVSGFQFEIYLPNSNSLHGFDGQDFSLVQSPKEDCERFDPSAPDCAIVVVSNIGAQMVQDDGSGLDTHFEALYFLLANPARERFIPVLEMEDKRKDGPGNPPGSKCFGGLVEQ